MVNICHSCIEPIIQSCPLCKQESFTVFFDKSVQRKVQELKIQCTNKKHGCKWVGILGNLQGHFEDCQFVEVDCTNGCTERVHRYKLEEHLSAFCPRRSFSCEYCGFIGKYVHVVEEHWPVCTAYLVPCPNGCEIRVKRSQIGDHLSECSYQLTECDFSGAGCEVKFLRKDQAKHMEEGMQDHQLAMWKTIQKLQRYMEFQDKQIEELKSKIEALEKNGVPL